MYWTLIFASTIGVWTFWCTRGRDGRWLESLVGFGAFAIVYWSMIVRGRLGRNSKIWWHVVVFEVAVAIGLFVRPELDEMGGTLNILIPLAVLAIVGVGLILSRFAYSERGNVEQSHY